MKAICLLAATLCILAWSQTSIAADAPPIRAIYQRVEDYPNLITGLKFKEVRTGKTITYHPKDDLGAEEGSLFYEPVFSPSGKWMFLPAGRFEGFIFFPTQQWREGLVDGTIGTRFRVVCPGGPALVHRFVKWLGDDEVRVTAGSDLTFPDIDINLRTRKAKVVKGTFPADWLHFARVRGNTMPPGKNKTTTDR